MPRRSTSERSRKQNSKPDTTGGVPLPEFVRIGYECEKLTLVKNLSENDGLFGLHGIEIADGLNPAREVDVLIHEVLHALWNGRLRQNERGSLSEEMVIENLASGLAGVLLDNPRVVNWIDQQLRRQRAMNEEQVGLPL